MPNQPLVFSLAIAVIVWILWFVLAGPTPFDYIAAHWEITLTMVFGSLIAGATSEGGGAVAFPVFTKLLHIPPQDAKLFSLAIQSVGMTAASAVIIYANIQVEWRVIRWATLGGLFGMVVGAALAPYLPPPVLKMSFTAMIGSFAVTLLALNAHGERFFHSQLSLFGGRERIFLVVIGFCGGTMGGLIGNGIDIMAFSLIVLLFRLSEKVATPTSVILMAINAIVGFAWHVLVLDNPETRLWTPQVQAYWLAAIPVVVVGAPMGAMLCSWLERITIARILIGLVTLEVISSLLIIPLTPLVIATSSMTLLVFGGSYYWMYRTTWYEG